MPAQTKTQTHLVERTCVDCKTVGNVSTDEHDGQRRCHSCSYAAWLKTQRVGG